MDNWGCVGVEVGTIFQDKIPLTCQESSEDVQHFGTQIETTKEYYEKNSIYSFGSNCYLHRMW